MLKNLFRPKWENTDETTRLDSIKDIPISNTALLKKIALQDSSTKVKAAAIQRIESPTTLLEIASTDKHLETQAMRCWVALLCNGISMPLPDAEKFVLDCKDAKLLIAIIAYSTNESLQNLAIETLDNESSIIETINSTRQAKVWQLLIPKITTESGLEETLDIIKGKDKRSQQLIKEKLSEIKSKQEDISSHQQEAQYLIQKLELLIQTEYDPLLEGHILNTKQKLPEYKAFLTNNELYANSGPQERYSNSV